MEFTYNASAVAAGGIIGLHDGRKIVIPSLASVALAPTGGEGASVQTRYDSEELSFSRAETRVFGREVSKNVFTTWTDVMITNLRILDVLSVAMLYARVSSTRSFDGNPEDDHAFDVEASYHGVLVRNHGGYEEVCPRLDVSLSSVKRYRHLNAILDAEESSEGITTLETPDGAELVAPRDKQNLLERFNAPNVEALKCAIAENKPVQGSLVDELVASGTRRGHKLLIPGVGTVQFGELMLKPGRRRLNLLRLSFGTPHTEGPLDGMMDMAAFQESSHTYTDGSMTVGSTEGNGSHIYP